MDFIRLDINQFRIFLLVMIRCSVILAILPLFGSRNWPMLIKAGLILLMAVLLFPGIRVQAQSWPLPQTAFDHGLLVLTEVMIALCLGMCINLILAGIQTGAQLVGFQMGFGLVNVLDPQSGTQLSVMAQVAFLIAMLFFLNLDGHHWFILALADSFDKVRPGTIVLSPGLFQEIIGLGAELFIVAIKVVAPAIAVLLCIHTSMGIIAKSVPQIHVFLLSFPVTISAGLFFFGLSLTLLAQYMDGFVNTGLGTLLGRALRELGGG